MATKSQHLKAIIAMRLEWSTQDKIMAEQLAGIRYKLECERAKASKAPATVPTAAGSEKANPIFSIIDKLAKQESQLTRRLKLGAVRTAGGKYEANSSPAEARKAIWTEYQGYGGIEYLVPGSWWAAVWRAGVSIPEDGQGWPNNPLTMPVAGKVHEVTDYWPVSGNNPPTHNMNP